MTIKEVERKTGMARSNIRFYEKEGLIQPVRNNKNGYRDYSEENVADLIKIAYLRTLGISIEEIHNIMDHRITLQEAVRMQEQRLETQIADFERARKICQKMLDDESLNYEELNVNAYVPELSEYWGSNRDIFRLDSVGFLYLWGGSLMWAVIAGICLLLALALYPHLPERIPIQYSGGQAVSTAAKIFIFAYPVACVAIRLFCRAYFRWKLRLSDSHMNDVISDYLTNFLCFVVMSAEVFSILFVYGYVKNIVPLLFVDTVVLIGLLMIGGVKLSMEDFDR